MSEETNGNGSKWSSWRKYVEEMARDVRELKEKMVDLRIELAVTKTKLGIYVAIICFVVSLVMNVAFIWLRAKGLK